MVIEACGRDLLEGQVIREGRTRPGESFQRAGQIGGRDVRGLLELLVLVDDLDAMLVLLLGRLFAHICKVAVDRHDGRGRGMPSVGGRATRCREGRHDARNNTRIRVLE